MYRHFRRGGAGFSLVELLVTIIIASIAFAALVPVFVTASQQGLGDSSRNVALNLAQKRIEQIRQLDYDLITKANLVSTFGTSESVPGGGGAKTYTEAYSVTFVGGTADGADVVDNTTSGNGTEQYKLVKVDVYWTGNPRPVKHAVLQTIVYKQYTGSYLDSLGVLPTSLKGTPQRTFVTAYTGTLTAQVNRADIANTKSVVFKVYGLNGNLLQRLVRNSTPGVTDTGQYTQTFTISALPAGSVDGVYGFTATAINKNGYAGNTQTRTLPVETGAPPAPTSLVAAGSNNSVSLSWTPPTAGDVTSYEVFRRQLSTGAYGTTALATVAVVMGQAPTYLDRSVSNGTAYFYKVRALDPFVPSPFSSETPSITPNPTGDTTLPSDVSGFTVTQTGTTLPPLKLRLVWTQATDNVAVTKYYVYRKLSTDSAYPVTPTYTILASDLRYNGIPSPTQYTYDDATGLAPSATYNYQIVAADAGGNTSLKAATGTATTLNYTYCPVTLKNNNTTSGASLEVTDPVGNLVTTWPGFSKPASNPIGVNWNGSETWYLPVGFNFVAGWKLSELSGASAGASAYTFKPIPAAGVILNITPFTVSFP